MSIIRKIHPIAFAMNSISIGLFFGINIATERGFSLNSSWQHYEESWLIALMAWVVIGALAALFHWLSWKPHAWFEFASTLGSMAAAIWWLLVLNPGNLLAALPAVLVLLFAPFGFPPPAPGSDYDRLVRSIGIPIGIRLKAILLSPAFAPEPSAAELAARDEWDAKRRSGEQHGW